MTEAQTVPHAKNPIWLVALAYVCAFALGSFIDIIRHSFDRILPAIQSSQVDDAIIQRGLIAALLTIVVVSGVYIGSRWSGARLGSTHRTGLQALFVLTPVVVYILEH